MPRISDKQELLCAGDAWVKSVETITDQIKENKTANVAGTHTSLLLSMLVLQLAGLTQISLDMLDRLEKIVENSKN